MVTAHLARQDRFRPTALEIAAGMVSGDAGAAVELPHTDLSPLEALGSSMLGALARPPCLVSFSGGRDSSAVLAVAAMVARREGLPLPIPVTQRYPDAPDTEESTWQELVVRHLDLHDWHRMEVTDELDLVGPVSARVHQRHGVLWPPNAYLHAPLLEEARGGSLLTGFDGDGLWGGWRWCHAADARAGRSGWARNNLLHMANAATPTRVRQVVERRRHDAALTWLRPDARRRMQRSWAAERSSEPPRWDRWLGWWANRRYLAVLGHGLDLLAGDADAVLTHPLLDLHFLAALARAGGHFGFGRRTAVTSLIFGGVLPHEVLVRSGKAVFTDVFWREGSRRFIQDWDGTGVDPDLVDAEALRQALLAPRTDFRIASPLLSAFLVSLRGSGTV